jgi:ornithine decarboxylase
LLHVGSLCDDLNTFQYALEYIYELKQKVEEIGLKVNFIDIGGGFFPLSSSSHSTYSFSQITSTIKATIDKLFSKDDITFIAEPGRFIATDYMDLYLPIIGSKIISENNDLIQYLFIPDGTYGTFNCLIYDHAKPHFEMKTVNSATKLINSTPWGQTCDSFDIVYVDLSWPYLTDGDWFEFQILEHIHIHLHHFLKDLVITKCL